VIDLHTHSTVSDGSDSPARVAELAAAAGCTAFALTDHDRLDGVEEARARGRELGVEVVTGCELSCSITPFGHGAGTGGTIHMLAYFVDGDGPLGEELVRLQHTRDDRNLRLADRLGELGLPVTLEEMEAEAAGEGVGRPHAAAVLVAKGVVDSVQEAFDRYLARGRPGYVERERLTAEEGVALVRASGGVAVLAHPRSLTSDLAELEAAVGGLAALGLSGLEADYGRYSAEERADLAALAHRHGLVATGGSDYHGTYKPDLSVGTGRGDLCVPGQALDELAARRP
jgi:predicted metal-dependent phosphoesterase TrpH